MESRDSIADIWGERSASRDEAITAIALHAQHVKREYTAGAIGLHTSGQRFLEGFPGRLRQAALQMLVVPS